jgi:hypothetical protein
MTTWEYMIVEWDRNWGADVVKVDVLHIDGATKATWKKQTVRSLNRLLPNLGRRGYEVLKYRDNNNVVSVIARKASFAAKAVEK